MSIIILSVLSSCSEMALIEWSELGKVQLQKPVVEFLLVQRFLQAVNLTLKYIDSALGKFGMRFAHFQLLAQLLLRFLVVVLLLPVMFGLRV